MKSPEGASEIVERRRRARGFRQALFILISMEMKTSLTSKLRCLISSEVEVRGSMDAIAAVSALGALAQEHRLALFRLLVQAGEDGMPAGAIAETLGIPNSSLSFHLAQLSKAGLVRQERRHRSIIYRADYAAMNGLVGYLMENCCAGSECRTVPGCGVSPGQVQSERKSV